MKTTVKLFMEKGGMGTGDCSGITWPVRPQADHLPCVEQLPLIEERSLPLIF